jgi:hypothetical protein
VLVGAVLGLRNGNGRQSGEGEESGLHFDRLFVGYCRPAVLGRVLTVVLESVDDVLLRLQSRADLVDSRPT